MTTIDDKLRSAAFINGQWRAGSAGEFDVRSPLTQEVMYSVGRSGPKDVADAIAAAKAAQAGWRDTSVVDRAIIMRRMHALFVEHAEEMAQMVVKEVAKPIAAAREETFEYAAPSWGKAAEEILRFRGMTLPSTQDRTNNKRLVLNHRPLGVIGVITPYNFPTDISSIALAHAAVAGNTIVWKPTEYAPIACAMVTDLFNEAGVPPGVINMVQGLGDTGAAIVDSKDVHGIFFTGSTKTGEAIARANPLRSMLLELGGDGPMIVLEDADIEEAIEGAITGCFYYSGQVCTSSERILVHEAVYDEFVDGFRKAASTLKLGDPADEAVDMGPLCNQVTLDRAKAHVADAKAKGAAIEQFGEQTGLFYPPTILTDVTDDMVVVQEESFSPIAVVTKVKSAQEAIDIANKSDLGLVASLWTKNLSDAWRVAEALPHGTVNVNETTNYWDQLAPFGGAGRSGVGRELSQWFMESFTEQKLINFDLGGPKSDRRIAGGW